MSNAAEPKSADEGRSHEAQPGFRIVASVLIIGIAVASLVWLAVGPAVDPTIRLLAVIGHLMLTAIGVGILIGRTRGGQLVLTRRRWRYAISVFIGGIGLISMILSIANPQRSPPPALYSLLLGIGLTQLFESTASANFRAASLSDSDAKSWKRIMIALFVGGMVIVAGSVAATALTAGAVWAVAPIPFGLMVLGCSGAVWALLRARKSQLRTARDSLLQSRPNGDAWGKRQ